MTTALEALMAAGTVEAGSRRGAANGYAPLDSGVLVPVANLPVGTGAAQVAAGNHTHAGYALDRYPIDGTYGDPFTGGSLNARWTRRGFTSGNETYAQGIDGTYLRIAMTGRAVGDGYFQTAPAGDWMFAMKSISRFISGGRVPFGLCVINSSGTGLGNAFTDSPQAQIMAGITTYTTYSTVFVQQPTTTQFSNPDVPIWQYLRKASGNYFCGYSYDGELWSPESPPFASGITVDRVGFIWNPVSAMYTPTVADIDWFNKI